MKHLHHTLTSNDQEFVSQRPLGPALRDAIMASALTAVIGVYANPESSDHAGDALVNSVHFRL